MLHSPLLQLTKNRRHLSHFKLWFYYSTFITNNEVKNENRLSVFRSRQDTGREGTFILTFHTAFLVTGADPSHSFRMTFYRPLSLRTGGRKRIFILFFCVVPPSQYPPSGSAGHLLINKEAYPIPILPVRIPFLNTVANPLLAL